MLFPNKPKNKISQAYENGIVAIYKVTNSAAAGYAPVETLTKKYDLRFDERFLGINRYYQAKQNQIRVEKVIRVPRVDINSQDVAIIGTRQYRVDLVQAVDEQMPPSLDLTLVRIEQGQEYSL